jgi:hypothetical protein
MSMYRHGVNDVRGDCLCVSTQGSSQSLATLGFGK